MRPALVLIIVALTVATAELSAPQRGGPALPPLSWTCPMHPEVVDGTSGSCPTCRMALVPVRLELDWSCPLHTSFIETAAGKCPICRRDLVQVTAAVSWTCPAHSEINELGPGRCRIDGRELVVKRERRPHGDHNPRHGGVFFMSQDNTHHLEGTLPSAGVFRLFVYDEYTRPLPPGSISGRAVMRETFDRATNSSREIDAVTLRPSKDGRYLEASIGAGALPRQVTAKVRFDPRGPEQRFDFSFSAYSTEPTPSPAGAPAIPAAAMSATPATQPLPQPPAASTSVPSLLAELTARGDEVRALLEKGAYTDMYFPALAAKEAALALEERAGQLPDARRHDAADAVRRVVLAAWLVDLYGDLGNKPKLTEAYEAFAGAITDLRSAYGTSR